MRRPTISVIIPSIARKSLIDSIASLADQSDPSLIEPIIVFDSHRPAPPDFGDLLMRLAAFRDAWHFVRSYTLDAGHHCSGNCQRNYGMLQAKGKLLAFLDDDDIWSPSAQDAIEQHAKDRPVVFRMRYNDGRVLWRSTEIVEGNVGTPMIVVPNDPYKLGTWSERYEADFDFLLEMSSLYDGRVDWRTDVIAEIRPEHPWPISPKLASTSRPA